MPGYNKNVWVDQEVERPRTYEMINNSDGSITLIDSPGLVSELGTPVNADNMNHIEEGIENCELTKWNENIFYSKHDMATYLVDDEKKVFVSLKDENQNHLPTDTEYWEEKSFGGSSSGGFDLFDVVQKDHELTFQESKGLAPLGSYVYKEGVAGTRYGYPNFYNKVTTEKEASTSATVNLGGNDITIYTNSNGHQFYDIADKDIIDIFYNSIGVAWYYGVDIENERVFLPRNDYIFYNGSGNVGQLINPELPNISGSITNIVTGYNISVDTEGCISTEDNSNETLSAGTYNFPVKKIKINASDSSSIYKDGGTVKMSGAQAISYMVVGNTSEIIATTVEITSDTAEAPLTFDSETGALKLLKNEDFVLDNDGNLSLSTNPSQTFKDSSVDWSSPDYSAAITLTDPFTAPCDGYIYLDVFQGKNRWILSGTSAGSQEVNVGVTSSDPNSNASAFCRISKGQTVKKSSTYVGTNIWSYFYPCKGVSQNA